MQALVYGWYNKANLGDELFKLAFQKLFPNFKFTFTDKLDINNTEAADIIIFGGGSFLYAPVNFHNKNRILDVVKEKLIFYIGVGTETQIHPDHIQIMQNAQLIATRTKNGLEKLKFTQAQKLEIPDIVLSLKVKNWAIDIIPRSLLIINNAELLPRWDDPNWKHASWSYFKSEMSQFLDYLKDNNYKITFAPMCVNNSLNDLSASTEIINYMKKRNFSDLNISGSDNFEKSIRLISAHETVVSQRYHGAILAQLCNKPCITIAHHDKLKYTDSSAILSYYEISKEKLINTFNSLKKPSEIPISLNNFEHLQSAVQSLIGNQCPNLSE